MTDPAQAKRGGDTQAARLLNRVVLARWWEDLRASPRALEPRRLIRFGRKSFSQNDEDGLLAEIFARIGVGNRHFVEFGVQTGVECNTALLLSTGWSGLWLESSAENVAVSRDEQGDAVKGGRLQVEHAFVTAGNINALLDNWRRSTGTPAEIDLLSVDIDGNDYWVWKAISAIRPRVVVIEYNATYAPPVDFLVPYEPEATWNRTCYFGSSLTMLERLGRRKGYALVGCGLAGVNAFFVREDALIAPDGAERFHAPFTAEEHYEPARYGLCGRMGAKPAFGANDAMREVAALERPQD